MDDICRRKSISSPLVNKLDLTVFIRGAEPQEMLVNCNCCGGKDHSLFAQYAP